MSMWIISSSESLAASGEVVGVGLDTGEEVEEEGGARYWRTVKVMVAKEMARRRNQETPWRVRRGSVGSERVWFC